MTALCDSRSRRVEMDPQLDPRRLPARRPALGPWSRVETGRRACARGQVPRGKCMTRRARTCSKGPRENFLLASSSVAAEQCEACPEAPPSCACRHILSKAKNLLRFLLFSPSLSIDHHISHKTKWERTSFTLTSLSLDVSIAEHRQAHRCIMLTYQPRHLLTTRRRLRKVYHHWTLDLQVWRY